MSFFKKLEKLDRRIIYIVITLAVILPFFFPMHMPITIQPEVKSIYDYIESLTPTDIVLFSGDYDPQVEAELSPFFMRFRTSSSPDSIPTYIRDSPASRSAFSSAALLSFMFRGRAYVDTL